MMLEYPIFHRRFSIRRYDQLVDTEFNTLSTYTLPIGSVLHYLGESIDSVAPATNYQPILNYTGLKYVDYVTSLKTLRGDPRKLSVPLDPVIKLHQRTNRTIRPVRKLESALRERKSLVIVSYALASRTYRYRMDLWSNYNKWYNMMDTVIKTIEEMIPKTGMRQHFLEIPLPSRLNEMSIYRRAGKGMSQQLLPHFQDPRNLNIMTIMQWLSAERGKSLLANIKTENLKYVNLCWVVNGSWTFINLDVLNKWRLSSDESEGKEGIYKPKQMQTTFMAFLLNVMNQKLNSVDTDVIEGLGRDIVDFSETEARSTKEDVDGGELIEDNAFTEANLDDVKDDEPLTLEEEEALNEKVASKVADFDASVNELNAKLMAAERAEVVYKPKEFSPLGVVEERASKLAEAGAIPAENYRRVARAATAFERIKSPFGGDESLGDFIGRSKEDLNIPDDVSLMGEKDGVTDKSLLNNTKDAMFKTYMRDHHDKYMAKTVLSVQQAGIALRDYKVKTVENQFNHYEVHSMSVVSPLGEPSAISFKVPKVRPDGTYIYNGNRMRMRSQRGDLPIRKISHREVALSSYYPAKIMISRSERAAFNYGSWLIKTLVKRNLDDPEAVSGLKYDNVTDPLKSTPEVFSILAREYSSFMAGDYYINLDANKQAIEIPEDMMKGITTQLGNVVPIGNKGDYPLVMSFKGSLIYSLDLLNGNLNLEGTIEELATIDEETIAKRPYEIVEFTYSGKTVPIGFVLGYHLGLSGMINFLKLEVQRLPRFGEGRYRPGGNDIAITFQDEVIVISRDDRLAMFTLGSMMRYRNDIRRHPVALFEKRDGWQTVLGGNGVGVRHTRELDNIQDMFIDPITFDVLKEMKEPTDMLLLYKRALEMLMDDVHRPPTYFYEERDKGYERFVGFAYAEIAKAIRTHRNRGGFGGGQVTMNPEAVWMQCIKDPASIVVQESNPVHNIKERDVVIYGGTGGRSARTMTAKFRTYDESDVGITGEGTVDSGSVGTVMFITADPKYGNVLGMADPNKKNSELKPANLQTYPMAITAGADRDDPKRNLTTGIQWSQTIATEGYTPSAIRTGAERTMALRNDEMFCSSAEQDGVVESIDADIMVVIYKDGTKKVLDMGRSYGNFAGNTIPHSLKTDLRPGAKFKAGDFLAYNSDYYTPDGLSKGQLLFKPGVLARTAFLEGPDTFEDSSAISPRLANLLRTNMTTPINVRVRFDQNVRGLIKVGSEVDIETILCTIENPNVSEGYQYGDDAGDILKRLDSINPKASRMGKVERIDLYYNGLVEDMTDSLRSVARQSDRRMVKRSQALGGKSATGEVEPGFSVDGKTLGTNEAIMMIYVTGPVEMGVGDKAVFGSQLKSIVGRVLTGDDKSSEDGLPIDAYFGYQSSLARIVESISILGTTSSLCVKLSELVVAAYKS